MSTTISSQQLPSVVIDNGSGFIKAGIAGYESPTTRFSNIIGKAKDCSVLVGTVNREFYVGQSAQSKRGILQLSYTMEHGLIENYDAWESVISHTYYSELKLAPEEQPLLMTDAPLTPKTQREKMTEILMEKLEVPAFYLGIQGALGLMASGRLTGVCLDVGDGATNVVPMYDGQLLLNAVLRLNIAGRDVTGYLMKMLSEKDYNFHTTSEHEIIRNLKEQHCYVALDFQEELEKADESSSLDQNYELPDGTIVTVNSERFRAPEVLFYPQLIGMESSGIHEVLFESISRSPIDVRKTLYHNTVLTGGSTLMEGLEDRLTKEMTEMAPSSMDIRVVATPNRENLTWIGGSIMATLSSFFNMCITKDEYYEHGADIVHHKVLI
ncbi:hypothetical protein C9374_001064 [Naegleria lovaniensis]|uniref:Actin n=1 Tax=Naegleria lovaniensis TaxID=51637 RepID=A0AA88GY49_NAELO|nr:uncharacterized protein C9374_001064 [Naegleria lovaniensis]KAG2388214.1 hypothetical protein C9374_001064 [Naegleria lovaniensis]